MNRTIKTAFTSALMLSAVLGLAGCGGGGTTPPATNTTPVANFTFTPASGPAALTVATTNTSTDADAGDTLTYDWNWGDSSPNDTTAAPTHTYASAGTFTITLKTTDNKGASNVKTASVTVTTAAPVAPTITSVTPDNGSVGNLTGQPIVITFSTPMNALVTQGAYISPAVTGSTALATNSSSFSWSGGNTVLTITPTTTTAYSTTPTVPIKYNYALTTAAVSAAGLPLANQFDGNYSTAVKYTAALKSDPNLDLVVTDLTTNFSAVAGNASPTMGIGDNAANKQLAAYLSFDLSALPTGLTSAKIIGAILKVTSAVNNAALYVPGTGLVTTSKKLSLYSLFYGTAFTGTPANLQPPNELAVNLDGTNPATRAATFSPSVLSAVQADWTNKTVQGNLSQYQLRFPVSTNGVNVASQQLISSGKSTVLAPNRPTLTVDYLLDN